MAHTIGAIAARASAATSPVTVSHTMNPGETLLVVMLKVTGATDRAGGALTYGTQTLSQANVPQKAAASPEASTELWYLLHPTIGTATLTIPNTGSLTVFYVRATAKAPAGGRTVFSSAAGSNGTSTNPTTGTIDVPQAGNILFATVCSGATTWAPTARTGIQIQDTDDGADGGGTQYLIQQAPGAVAMTWTFATSDDWGAVGACFSEQPAVAFNNYVGGVRVGSGMSTGERVR